MTYDNNYLCTSIPSKFTKPIIGNSGTFYPQSRSVSVITIQAPTDLNPKHIYKLSTSDNLPDGLIPLAVDHKVDHKYAKLLTYMYSNHLTLGFVSQYQLYSVHQNLLIYRMQTSIQYHGQNSRNYYKTYKNGWTPNYTTTVKLST